MIRVPSNKPSTFLAELWRESPAWVAPAVVLLYFLRFGYDYGISDQDEIIPFLLHRLDPSLFTQDWFVMLQAGSFGIRSYFVTMLQSLGVFIPTWLAVLVFYVLCWLFLAAAVYVFSHAITGSRLAAAATTVVVLVMTPQWTLGGNDIAVTMLVPSMVAWCLGIWGLVFFLHRHVVWSALLLGLAVWMQALVGLQLTGLLGLHLLFQLGKEGRTAFPQVFMFSGVFLLSALPALGPLVYQQLGNPPGTPASNSLSLFYIMAAFRNPHHYLFFSYPIGSILRFGLLMLLGGVSFVLLSKKKKLSHGQFLLHLFALIFLCCLVAFLLTEVIPILFIAKLQFFKMTVLTKLLLLSLTCGATVVLLPDAWTDWLDRHLIASRKWGTLLTLLAWFAVGAGIMLQVTPLHTLIRPFARSETPAAQIARWAVTQSPPDALFAVPPSWSGFRSEAQRAIVIDFKAFPFEEAFIYTWFERLTDLAPITLPERGSPALQAQLDTAFLQQSPTALHALAEKYGVTYVVRDTPIAPEDATFETVYAKDGWFVYRYAGTENPTE